MTRFPTTLCAETSKAMIEDKIAPRDHSSEVRFLGCAKTLETFLPKREFLLWRHATAHRGFFDRSVRRGGPGMILQRGSVRHADHVAKPPVEKASGHGVLCFQKGGQSALLRRDGGNLVRVDDWLGVGHFQPQFSGA